MAFPIPPPVEPMLARASEELPGGGGLAVRAEVGRLPHAGVPRRRRRCYLQSRELKPLNRYFPELAAPLRAAAAPALRGRRRAGRGRAGRARLRRPPPAHPPGRVPGPAARARSSRPAWCCFDLLALGDATSADAPLVGAPRPPRGGARAARGRRSTSRRPPAIAAAAADWFRRFEGAGLDGVVAKRLEAPYQPGVRAMVKVKHARTADCAVAGFRWHKDGPGTMVGSLLLGLHDDAGTLHHVGICSALHHRAPPGAGARARAAPEPARREPPLARLGGAVQADADAGRSGCPGAQSRWNRGKDLSWEPLRVERVCEVAYDHLQGDRFRHATHFVRWRPDRSPRECRYDQLEVTPPYELARIFGPESRSGGALTVLRPRRPSAPRGLHARRLVGAAGEVRRPGRVALPLGPLPRGRELEQRLERARGAVDARPPDRRAGPGGPGTVRSVKSAGSQAGSSSQVSGRRDARVGRGPHRVGGGDGAVLGVLVVVEEDAVPLLLPPLAGGELGRAPLHLARQRQRRPPHLGEAPARRDPHVDVDAARAAGLGPAGEAVLREHLAHQQRPPAGRRPRRRPAPGSRSTRSSSGCSRSSARTGCGWRSMQPRFTTQASWAASRTTISSRASAPRGSAARPPQSRAGREVGARFW